MTPAQEQTLPFFKEARQVTIAEFNFEKEKPLAVKLLDKIIATSESVGRGDNRRTATVRRVRVKNLMSQVEGKLVIPEALDVLLSREYPGDSYMGKCFRFTQKKKHKGERYRPWDVVELEEHATAPAPAADPPAAPAENGAATQRNKK
jgi:hypothetical protein